MLPAMTLALSCVTCAQAREKQQETQFLRIAQMHGFSANFRKHSLRGNSQAFGYIFETTNG
jgi:hypothetical protein